MGPVPEPREQSGRDLGTTFLQWMFVRAVFHRGYVLVSSLHFVIDAHLSASQLVLLGTVSSITLLASDIPTGVWSDTFSRKWPLVIGHVLLASGMTMTGVVTAFPLLLVTQALWGAGWGFSSGADVAWVTDELDQPHRISRLLATRARMDLLGSAVGMVAFGLLGWATTLATATAASGLGMALVGVFVVAGFPERNFRPERENRHRAAVAVFRRGIRLARCDHEVRHVLGATLIINGASMVGWLFPKQLIRLGFPSEPILWYTALAIVGFATGAVALRVVEARIDGEGAARRIYASSCFVGTLGVVLLAGAPGAVVGSLGVLLANGIAFNVTRAVSVIWINRRATSDVRATMHSFLSQAECVGEILSGFALAAIAAATDIPVTLLTSAALILLAGGIVIRFRGDGATTSTVAVRQPR